MSYDPLDIYMLAIWLIAAVSAGIVGAILAVGIYQNHVRGHFRSLMSAMFMIAFLQSWFAFDKVLLRLNHIVNQTVPQLLTDGNAILTTTLVAIAWVWCAVVMSRYGKPMKKTITKDE